MIYGRANFRITHAPIYFSLEKGAARPLGGRFVRGGAAGAGGILVGGTRVVYDGAKRKASIPVKNTSQTPYVVQVWLDDGSENARAKTPFALTPPIFRLDPDKENNVRIMYSG